MRRSRPSTAAGPDDLTLLFRLCAAVAAAAPRPPNLLHFRLSNKLSVCGELQICNAAAARVTVGGRVEGNIDTGFSETSSRGWRGTGSGVTWPPTDALVARDRSDQHTGCAVAAPSAAVDPITATPNMID